VELDPIVRAGVAAKDCGDAVKIKIVEAIKEVRAIKVASARFEMITAIASSLCWHSNY